MIAGFGWAIPLLDKADPLWTEGRFAFPGVAGVFLAGIGGMLALAAQLSMGASGRLGMAEDETGMPVLAVESA